MRSAIRLITLILGAAVIVACGGGGFDMTSTLYVWPVRGGQ
jgi:hypothetical protein